MNSLSSNRRHFLKAAGATVALPFFESLLPRSAAAQGALTPPLRLAIFSVTGGTVGESWTPEKEGHLSGKLPSILRPLEFAKDDMLVISGLDHKGKTEGSFNAHQHCAALHLTGAPKVKNEGGKIISPPSIDQVAAEAIGSSTPLPSLEIGTTNHETRYSYRTNGNSVQYENNARLAFDRMFRDGQPRVPSWSSAMNRARSTARRSNDDGPKSYERSVLDIVMEEARALDRVLGNADREKFDQFLTSLRAVEKRIEITESRMAMLAMDDMDFTKPLIPGNLPDDVEAGNAMRQAVGRDPEVHGEYIELMSDLMVLAMQTDTTRVVTVAAGSDGALFPGVVTVGHERHAHTLEHMGNARRIEDADPIAREGCRQIHAWYTELFAKSVAKMKQIDEGGSSLLDNSMILYTSYMADGGHGRRDYPALIMGNAQGKIETGRHIAAGGEPMSNLFLSMLQTAGVDVDSFGESTGTLKGFA